MSLLSLADTSFLASTYLLTSLVVLACNPSDFTVFLLFPSSNTRLVLGQVREISSSSTAYAGAFSDTLFATVSDQDSGGVRIYHLAPTNSDSTTCSSLEATCSVSNALYPTEKTLVGVDALSETSAVMVLQQQEQLTAVYIKLNENGQMTYS